LVEYEEVQAILRRAHQRRHMEQQRKELLYGPPNVMAKRRSSSSNALRFIGSSDRRKLRLYIWERSARRCALCGLSVSLEAMSIDHNEPLLTGGLTVLDNLQASHVECNHDKGDAVHKERYLQRLRCEKIDAE
jgi:hypothetical protein